MEEITYFKDVLESLLEDLNAKSKEQLKTIISKMEKENLMEEDLIKIQEDLEQFTAVYKMDSFARTEIMNMITEIETIYNG